MKCHWENYYTALQTQLEDCRSSNDTRIPWIECCFQASSKATVSLLNEVAILGFASTEEEIQFFKWVKPKFTCEIEYFRLLYHAELFLPEDEKDWTGFWKREAERLSRFITENREFWEYIKRDFVDNDAQYFTWAKTDRQDSEVIVQRGEVVSTHDHLVASLLALEKYNEYVRRKLQDCR